jgi:hypothetical protein
MGAKVKFVSLRGWSVSAKISFGFAIVLLLHISIAVIAHYGLRKADEDRSQQDRLRSQVELFHDIDRIVGELQRNVLLFAYAGVKGPELRVVDIQNQLSGLLAEASQAGDRTEDGTISTMQSHLTTHRDIFEAVLTDRAKRRQLLDMDMVQYVQEFNAELEALRALVRDGLTGSDSRSDQEQSTEKIANHFQAAQLHAMRFVHSPDSSHVRNMKRELGGAKATLAFLLSDSEDVDQQRLKAFKV